MRHIRLLRSLVDRPFVFVHAFQDLDNGAAQWVTLDFLATDQDHRVVEHWDVLASCSASTPSGHTSVDGPTEVVDTERTEDNRALVRRLIEGVLLPDGNPANIDRYRRPLARRRQPSVSRSPDRS